MVAELACPWLRTRSASRTTPSERKLGIGCGRVSSTGAIAPMIATIAAIEGEDLRPRDGLDRQHDRPEPPVQTADGEARSAAERAPRVVREGADLGLATAISPSIRLTARPPVRQA
jgi:hypothetical protein